MSEQVVYEVNERDEIIKPVMEFHVSRLFVEFFQQGGPKPRVFLCLNINPRVKVDHKTYKRCRLLVDLEGVGRGISQGAFGLRRYVAYKVCSLEFKLKVSHWTIDNALASIIYPNNLLDSVSIDRQRGTIEAVRKIEPRFFFYSK